MQKKFLKSNLQPNFQHLQACCSKKQKIKIGKIFFCKPLPKIYFSVKFVQENKNSISKPCTKCILSNTINPNDTKIASKRVDKTSFFIKIPKPKNYLFNSCREFNDHPETQKRRQRRNLKTFAKPLFTRNAFVFVIVQPLG